MKTDMELEAIRDMYRELILDYPTDKKKLNHVYDLSLDGIPRLLSKVEVLRQKIERLEKENKSLKEKAYRNTLSKLSDSDFGRIL